MAIQDFVAGQVLTAAQMDALQANDYNQTVSNKTASYTLVAADKGTRVVMSNAGSTTITVNTSLFSAGDTLYIQNIGAGTCTITAGTATVTTTSSLALRQWGGGLLYFTSAGAAIFFAADVSSQTIAAATVTTSQATTSTSYTDLATAGPAVTVTTGTSALVTIQTLGAGAVSNRQLMSFAVSGATTIAAGTYVQGVTTATDDSFRVSSFVVTGLTAGSNTFTTKYKSSDGNSIPFAERVITVTPL